MERPGKTVLQHFGGHMDKGGGRGDKGNGHQKESELYFGDRNQMPS